MRDRSVGLLGRIGAGLFAVQLVAAVAVSPAVAVSKPKEEKMKKAAEAGPIGYGGPRLRMLPIMVPVHTSGGVQFQPLIIEMALSGGVAPGEQSLATRGDAREKQACFALPLLHEQFLYYFYRANLKPDDLVGQHREVLEKDLFDVTLASVGRGYYTGLSLVADDAPALDPQSETLSKQCR
jgi:hypothetical protein